MTVEGFSNYATAGVAMTLENDRAMAEHLWAGVRQCVTEALSRSEVREGVWNSEQAQRITLRDFLKDYVERLCERGIKDGDAGLMASQMVQAGLSEVDWVELTEHYLTLNAER